jgi:phosphoadenosine phosphosulfate reductase
MSLPDLVTAAEDSRALSELNQWLLSRGAAERAAWALEHLPGRHVLSSSFGAQSAAALHLLTCLARELPVILVDTGYLFPETYRFVDALSERLALNLHVFRATLTPSWIEARYGRLWEQDVDGIERYNRLVKVEPMQRALKTLGANTWFAGLRRTQSLTRRAVEVLELRDGRWKVHPIVDWSDRDVWAYLTRHDLPYHPLWHEGYVSIGDVHSTRRLEPGMREEDTRFGGLKRECGLHGLEG